MKGINLQVFSDWITWRRNWPRHLKIIRDGGFDTVRLALDAFRYMDASNNLPQSYFDTVADLIDEVVGLGMTCIVDEHDFTPMGNDPTTNRPKLAAFWTQICDYFRYAPPNVYFEILNEPNTNLTATLWNDILAQNLGIIRALHPTRKVIIGPINWYNPQNFPDLVVPSVASDPNIILTYHYYSPIDFTMQGYSGRPPAGTVTWGTSADYATVENDFNTIKTWNTANGNRAMLLGEFGSTSPWQSSVGAPIASRELYAGAVARSCERHGFSWATWLFDLDFAIYDTTNDHWIGKIRDSLLPGATMPSFVADFESLTIQPVVPADNWGTGCYQQLAGQTVNVLGGGAKILHVTDPLSSTPNADLVMTATISGKKYLDQQILQSQNGSAPQGTAGIQTALMFTPTRDAHTRLAMTMKFQKDLVQSITNVPDSVNARNFGTFRAVCGWKTGGFTAPGNPDDLGDYRVLLGVYTYDQQTPYWRLLADNATALTPAPALVNNFSMTNKAFPVPADLWFDIEMEWDRTSFIQVKFNGEVMFRYDGILMGANNNLINRIFAPVIYQGGFFPVSQQCAKIGLFELAGVTTYRDPGAPYSIVSPNERRNLGL